MKTIEAPVVETSRPGASIDRLVASLPIRRSPTLEAQESVAVYLGKRLNNLFILVRNVNLEGLKVPVPLTLVGPTGVHVLHASASRGVFQAKGEIWQEMDDRTRRFEPAQPDLIAQTLWLGRTVQEYLAGKGVSLPRLESVLIFTDPGTHVDATRPAVRIVLADAIERYASGLQTSTGILRPDDVQRIVDLLLESRPAASGLDPDSASAFSLDESGDSIHGLPADRKDHTAELAKRLPFSRRQWALLAVLLVVNILVLLAFILYFITKF